MVLKHISACLFAKLFFRNIKCRKVTSATLLFKLVNAYYSFYLKSHNIDFSPIRVLLSVAFTSVFSETDANGVTMDF